MYHRWNRARQGRTRSRQKPRWDGDLCERRAGRFHSHRDLPVFHDVSHHGENRFRRSGESRTQSQARAAHADRQLGNQTFHDARHRHLISWRIFQGSASRNRNRERRQHGRTLPLLYRRGHSVRHRTLHRDGLGVESPRQRQPRPHPGHGCDQLPDHAVPLWTARKLVVRSE